MKTECPFVVGEWYQFRGEEIDNAAKFVAYEPEADFHSRAIFLYDGMIISRYADGRRFEDRDTRHDILPPEPKLVERWVAVVPGIGRLLADKYLFASEEAARVHSPDAHSYHKIEVPE